MKITLFIQASQIGNSHSTARGWRQRRHRSRVLWRRHGGFDQELQSRTDRQPNWTFRGKRKSLDYDISFLDLHTNDSFPLETRWPCPNFNHHASPERILPRHICTRFIQASRVKSEAIFIRLIPIIAFQASSTKVARRTSWGGRRSGGDTADEPWWVVATRGRENNMIKRQAINALYGA